ncbi:Heat shock protein 70 family [Sesbania bispinosa]|nr:Heat shock protein 70 family [Sesbania bispinosa]
MKTVSLLWQSNVGLMFLLNDESKRETPAVVCFGEKQRFLGSAGASSAMMHPKTTISQIKRLIGRKFADPDVEKELKMLPVETSEGSDGGILIHLKYLEETHTFTPVQIMSMLFAHLKTMTEKDLETPISDCVIGVHHTLLTCRDGHILMQQKLLG